jgi:hypothetical protein
MAKITHVGTVATGSQPQNFYDLIDNATIESIVNADIATNAAIVDTKLAQITTASKVSGIAITNLNSLPSSAGVLPAANLTASGTFVYIDEPTWNWQTANCSTNGQWHDMDWSALFPATAKALVFNVVVVDDAVGSSLTIKDSRDSSNVSGSSIYTQVANISASQQMIIPCPSTRILSYLATNTVWSSINLAGIGYFI